MSGTMSPDATRSVYDETYRNYLKQLKEMDFNGRENIIGVALEDDALVVPYFGDFIRLTRDGLKNEAGIRPEFSDCVVICRYLIMCPLFEPKEKQWAAFREFPDAGPLTVFWTDTVEGPLAKKFSGKIDTLKKACDVLGGVQPETELSCDLYRQFTPLPKVPLLLIFNDGDDEFPASASLLFEKRSSTYLDGESQAILGHILSKRLTSASR
jgi:hypothetical protein